MGGCKAKYQLVSVNGSVDGDEVVKALVVSVLWFFREYSTSATLRSDAVEELQTGSE